MIPFDLTLVGALAYIAFGFCALTVFMAWCCCRAAALADMMAGELADANTTEDE